MMSDCHAIFDFMMTWRKQNAHQGPLMVMGRSLGSASALELAAAHGDRIDALVIESGFAFSGPLLNLLGIDPDQFGFKESSGFSNLEKIGEYGGPTLIIHAEHDHIIPYADAVALFDASSSPHKKLLQIENANHNDIFVCGMSLYMAALRGLAARIRSTNDE